MQVSVAILKALGRVDPAIATAVLAELELDAWPEEAGASLSWSGVASALERAFDKTTDPTLALRAGAEISARALNIVGLVMMSAPTVRHIIEASVRFSTLVLSGARLELVERGDEALICFTPPPCSPLIERAVVEFNMVFVVHIASEVHQQRGHIRHVCVRHAAPSYAAAYQAYIGCPVTFGAPVNSISLDLHELDLSLPGGDPAMFELLCQRAEQAILYKEHAIPLSVRIKELLKGADLERTDVASMSTQLKLSASVLQRRLKDEGTSFSELVDETRRELALAAVLRADLPIKELSERLGFSETSAFHRAFRRWTGQTTREYRLQKLAR